MTQNAALFVDLLKIYFLHPRPYYQMLQGQTQLGKLNKNLLFLFKSVVEENIISAPKMRNKDNFFPYCDINIEIFILLPVKLSLLIFFFALLLLLSDKFYFFIAKVMQKKTKTNVRKYLKVKQID